MKDPGQRSLEIYEYSLKSVIFGSSDELFSSLLFSSPGYNRDNGYGGFIDPVTSFEKEKLPEMVHPGWAEAVCDNGANVRDDPPGRFVTQFPKSVRVRKTAESKPANGLQREKIDGVYRISGADVIGTIMSEDIEYKETADGD